MVTFKFFDMLTSARMFKSILSKSIILRSVVLKRRGVSINWKMYYLLGDFLLNRKNIRNTIIIIFITVTAQRASAVTVLEMCNFCVKS